MRRISLFCSLLLALSAPAFGQDAANFPKHEIRVGWGDMMYETAVFRNSPSAYNYGYTGHIFGEYLYGFTSVFGLGFEADFENVRWDTPQSDGHNFYNLTFMPTCRFTYYRKGIVTMYSGLGVGLTINGGSETDYKGRTTACAPALGITAYGISVNWNKLFGTFEVGGLNALVGKNEIYMAASRIFTISIGVRL